jgi:IrrE N-terminal-like domain
MSELAEANLAHYFGEDLETHGALVRSLARLPAAVREFAIDECVFVSIGKSVRGLCRPTTMVGEARWMIVLDERLAPSSIETAVAHEVAHAYLGHDLGDTSTTHEEVEAAARQLAREWGFRGFGAEPPGTAF